MPIVRSRESGLMCACYCMAHSLLFIQPRHCCLHTFRVSPLRKSCTGMPIGQFNLDNSSLNLSQVILDCIKMTIQTSHHGRSTTGGANDLAGSVT